MTVGERIKHIRSQLGMSQVAFADKIDVSKQTLYKYENNIITNIPSDKIEKVAEIGGVSPAYLMGWEDETIEIKYNTLSSCDSESLSRFADYLYLRERQLISDSNSDQYLDFIIAEKVQQLSDVGQNKVFSYTAKLLDVETADKELNAAHTRTDIDIPENTDTTDDDIMDDNNF